MRIYLASRYPRRLELQTYAAELTELGHEITSRWLEGRDAALDGSTDPLLWRRWATEDRADLQRANVLLHFADAPDAWIQRGSNLVEFGLALAFGKRVIAVGERQSIFHALPEVEFCATWDDARWLLGQGGPALPATGRGVWRVGRGVRAEVTHG